MIGITKSLRAFFYYLLCPLTLDGELGPYTPKVYRSTQVFFLIITIATTAFFRTLLAFFIPIFVYFYISLLCYHIDFRHNFNSFYDEASPLTYERFEAVYSCFPNRILCQDYISRLTLYLVVDEEDAEPLYHDEGMNGCYYRIIKPQTFPDAALIYYHLFSDYIATKRKKCNKETTESRQRKNKQKIKEYAIFKKYLAKDLATLAPETAKEVAKHKSALEDLNISP